MKRSAPKTSENPRKTRKIAEKSFEDFEIKEEPLDEEDDIPMPLHPSELIEPKEEPLDDYFLDNLDDQQQEEAEQPSSSAAAPQSSFSVQKPSSWGQNLSSLDKLLLGDWGTATEEEELGLGNSILFGGDGSIEEKKPESIEFPNISDALNGLLVPKCEEEEEEDWDVKNEPIDEDDEYFGGSKNSNLTWRPKVGSFDVLGLNESSIDDPIDSEEKDLEMQLGNSILFDEDKFKLPTREREFLEPRGAYRQIGRWSLRKELRLKFEKEAHPSIQSMIDMCNEYNVSYRTIFYEYEAIRTMKKTKCTPGDACERIRSYNERENEDWPKMRELQPKIRKILEDDIEAHIKTRKRFTLGYVHLLVEKTNLPPAFIRYQYGAWRGRLMYKQTHSIENWKRENTNDLSVQAVKILEETYLEKKYKSTSEEREWSQADLEALSEKLKLTVDRIQIWIRKRNDASKGKLEEEAVSIPVMARRCYISPIQKSVMNDVFVKNKNQLPRGALMEELEKRVNLKTATIRTYFNQRIRGIKQEQRFQMAKREMAGLPGDVVKKIQEYAQAVRRNEEENRKFARKVGISFESLMGFLEWKKSLMFRRKPVHNNVN